MDAIQAQKRRRVWKVRARRSAVSTHAWVIWNWDRMFGSVEQVLVLRNGKAQFITEPGDDPAF